MITVDIATLKKLIESGEGNTVEFQQAVAKDTGRTICAFANTDGGHLIIGVEKNGGIVGLERAKLDDLQQAVSNSYKICSPVPLTQVGTVEIDGKYVLVISTAKLGDGVCYYADEILLRVGSTNHKLTGPAIEEFLRKNRVINFDWTRSSAKLQDVDTEKMKKYMNRRSPNYLFDPASEKALKNLLISLHLAGENGDFYVRNGGVLFFAKHPETFIPQNKVKLVRFKGKIPVDVLDILVLQNTLVENIEESLAFIRRSTRKSYEIKNLEREEKTEYPEIAIREAIVNALVHRDYFSSAVVQVNVFDDRIDIANPGMLPTGISPEDLSSLGLGVPRNPIIYQMLIDIKVVEGIGTGIPRMISAMRDAGLPDPEFRQLGPLFKTTLFNAFPNQAGNLNVRQRRSLIYLKDNSIITAPQYRKMFKISHPIAVDDLNKLIKLGLVKKRGRGPATAYVLAKPKIKQ
jgi:ATP-dependent DNA helicase RecG